MIFLASDPYVGRRQMPATYSFYSSVPHPPGGNSFFRPSVGSQETYSTAIPCGRSAVEFGAERGRDIQICRLGGVIAAGEAASEGVDNGAPPCYNKHVGVYPR